MSEGASRFLIAWRKEERAAKETTAEDRAAENRQRKREAEDAERVVLAPGVTAAKLRRFRAALVGP